MRTLLEGRVFLFAAFGPQFGQRRSIRRVSSFPIDPCTDAARLADKYAGSVQECVQIRRVALDQPELFSIRYQLRDKFAHRLQTMDLRALRNIFVHYYISYMYRVCTAFAFHSNNEQTHSNLRKQVRRLYLTLQFVSS